ncbi:MAG: crotonobetainyl-CoA:carnitine CoA-transferase CaiB-like acyl-CoA transferase [Acidimicrobiales bacterium]|jgi:crotonobetainyl-CoA:carnitine CoA-transferase CaiB-like acyl-CoA transferase
MLEGIRILDLTQYLSGPSATLLLAGLGADVIKVEPGPVGDLSRLLPIVKDGHSSYYVQQNRGKRSVCVDLGKPEAHTLIRDMAMECDVVIENFSQGVLEKRGLGPDSLRALKPELIYVSISAYGRTGSKSHLPGYDLIGQAVAGSVALTGEPDGAPLGSGAPIADMSAGMMAFGAIGHALFSRSRTGEGQFVDVSMVEAVFQMHPFAIQGPSVTEGKARLKRTGRHFGSVPPAGTYQGPDGWLVLQVLDAQWARLCEAASAIALGDDERFTTAKGRADHRYELVDILESWMQTFPTTAAVLAHLEAHRVPSAPVIDPADAHLDPWFHERGAITEVEDPYLGTVRVPGFPLHTTAVPDRVVEPLAPTLGQHNSEVLTELLGYDDDRIAEFTDAGVLLER